MDVEESIRISTLSSTPSPPTISTPSTLRSSPPSSPTAAVLAARDCRFQTAKEVVKHVNLQVEKKTRGLIKDILSVDGVSSDTRLILANILYFKGRWAEKFDASKTKTSDFHLVNGSSVRVPFMSSRNEQCVGVFKGFKVLRLPYKRGDDKRCFSMYIFLPDAKDGFPSLMHEVTCDPGLLERCLPMHSVPVGEFRIPKFKLSFGIEVSEVLKELGVVSPFLGVEGITEMVEHEALYVSKIFHKSFIEVNEDGTEAACATEDEEMSIALFPDEDFVADHPFLYFIREDSIGVILLIGTLINPLIG
ncbi:unnamed protein product [Cuscuta campestris]|uniref:Serpin domain-containing protein n=1 Tax=Cuscuta campestris TaxID=132261 RepID=A0A484KIA9_9ASTE|nr:unnamed protein product [Cuscuta campestris]